MFDEKVVFPQQFTVRERNRKSTDVCCTIIGALFALVMFIVACTMWNKDKFESNFFGLRSGLTKTACENSQFVYSNNPSDYSKATCVDKCPNGFESSNQGLCLPDDQEQRSAFLENPDVQGPFDYDNFKKTLGWSALVAVGFGLLWMTLTWCAPKLAPIIAHVGAILLLIALGVLLLVLWDKFWSNNLGLKIFVAVVCFLLAIILLVMLCLYANERKWQGLFLDYGKRFLSECPSTFAYIPVFMLLALGLVALIVWQHCCFSSQSASNRNFFNFNNTGFWEILNILEFIWAFQFLRDAFNFCVGGAAVDWYWNRPEKTGCFAPFQRFLCRNWGSVVGGSFLNAFFEIPTLIAELLICHPRACCPKLGTCCYNSCSSITCCFDLVRQDAYSYINMSGIPFCNSARQCKKICESDPTFIGSHSPMKHYKFAAHVFCVAAVFLMTWFILRKRVNFPGFWHYAILIVLIYMCITWFVDMQAAAAEGIQTSYLAERELENGDHNYMQKCIPSYRTELEHMERRLKGEGDGHC